MRDHRAGSIRPRFVVAFHGSRNSREVSPISHADAADADAADAGAAGADAVSRLGLRQSYPVQFADGELRGPV
jgi:hypothetical protein